MTMGVTAFASLVGSGGGALIMPILLLLYPGKDQMALTFISLFAVLLNSVAATLHYARMKRIDYRTGLILGLCTIPTSAAARFALRGVDRSQFSRGFGFVLIGIGLFIIWRMVRKAGKTDSLPPELKPHWFKRRIVDSSGTVYEYAYNLRFGAGTAVAEGFMASFLGIGGGVLVMPMLTQLLHCPAHVAASTSMMMLSITALVGLLTDLFHHAATGTLNALPVTMALAAGVGALIGAQIGPRLSKRVSAERLLVLLSCAVILAGGRLALSPNHPEPPPEPAPDQRDTQPLNSSMTKTRAK